jgi:acetolactate synthase-1/2/3 large subunit
MLNDQTYGLIKWKQINRFSRPAFTDFGNPDFVKYAESFGAQAWRVQAAGELLPALQAALESGKLTVIDCPVDFGENLKLTERLNALAKAG